MSGRTPIENSHASALAASTSDIALAVVCSVVPDRPPFQTKALSRAANMFVANFLEALKQIGLPPSVVLSLRPIQSFPSESPLWLSSQHVTLREGMNICLLPLVNIKGLKQIAAGIATIVGLLRWGWGLGKDSQKLILVYNLTFPPALFVIAAARLLKAKSIAIVVDFDIPGEDRRPDTLLRRLDYRLQKWSIKKFNGLQTCTDYIPRTHAPGMPYVRIEGGVDPVICQESLSSDVLMECPEKGFTIVYAGRLSLQHGTDLLLKAFQLLPPQYRLIVAGDGPLSPALEEAAKQDFRIRFLGYIPFGTLLPYYRSADLFLSLWRSGSAGSNNFFPSKLIDYLATGKPVIATRSGHTEEEFGTFCYILQNETPEALADLIQRVACIPASERNRAGQQARAYMQANKTWDRQAQKAVKFIREIVLNEKADVIRHSAPTAY